MLLPQQCDTHAVNTVIALAMNSKVTEIQFN